MRLALFSSVKDAANLEFLPAGIKAKVENKHQYKEYLDELKEHREELGVPLQEEMYPEAR